MAETRRAFAQIEKDARALALAAQGGSYSEIAASLGYWDRSGAYKAVQRALKRAVFADAETYRLIHLAKLTALYHALQPRIKKGEPVAIRAAVRILEREAGLLGLDAPTKFDLRRIVDRISGELGLTDAERDEVFASVKAMLDEARGG